MILSIIIPTYNEEEHLPILLDSIKMQNFDDYEIIIAKVVIIFNNVIIKPP